MGNHKNRRSQTPKARNEALMRAMQDKRYSSAAEPHRNKAKYNRKEKYRGRDW